MSINIGLYRNANRNNQLSGRYPFGNAPVPLSQKLFEYEPLTTPQVLTLHPTGLAQTGAQIRFSFGIPFPKDALANVSNLVITDAAGNEIATHVELITPWRNLTDNSVGTVRSARVWMNYTFTDATPISLRFKSGTRTLELGAQTGYKNDWVLISNQPAGDYDYNDEFVTKPILEPIVYATQSPEYLCSCNMRPRMSPLNTTYSAGGTGWNISDFFAGNAWDDMQLGFANSVTNRVGAHVTQVDPTLNERGLVDYETNYFAWLYDRAQFLYVCYIRSGELKWLRSAVRCSQYYATLIDASGDFTLRPTKFMYNYGISPLMCIFTTGDTDQSAVLDKIVLPVRAANSGTILYRVGYGWTERVFGYAIEQELTNWEYTGDSTAYTNAKNYLASGIYQVANPVEGRQPNGTIQHTILDHEGGPGTGTGNEMIFSPWMCSILFNSYFRAYLLSGNNDYLRFIGGYQSEFEKVFVTGSFEGKTITGPWYITGEIDFTDAGFISDVQHATDVNGAIQLIMFARNEIGETISDALRNGYNAMRPTNAIDAEYFYRPTQETIDAGYTVWRASPYRRVFWVYTHAANLVWLETAQEGI